MGALERKRQKRIKEYVIKRDGLVCCYCNISLTKETVTMEHIVPDSKRGTYNTTNLTSSCSKCNNRRGNKPFFEYCLQFHWSSSKLLKYKRLYYNNLRIKILNIAKEECLNDNLAIPNELIGQACEILKIKKVDFSDYEDKCNFQIRFDSLCDHKKIKYCFESLIKIIEADNE